MKRLFVRVMGFVAGTVALFGISVANVTASTQNITEKSALYLEHGKSIAAGVDVLAGHGSHGSHGSHESHGSHVSHGSGR